MENNKPSIDDFEIYYKYYEKYYKYKHIIKIKTYYMINNYYFKIDDEYTIVGFDSLNIMDKLNLKRDYYNLFKELNLKTLIQMKGIRPVKKEDIPKGVKVKKNHPNIIYF